MSEESVTKIVRASTNRKVIKPALKKLKIPDEILNNANLQKQIDQLPKNYNFEIHKTIWRIKELNAKQVALQMPEGLLMFSTTIADILEQFTEVDITIMADVTYGACCIDDYAAKALKIDLLVHYGHSCLIPINQTENINVLYIFVDIKIDPLHLIDTIQLNFPDKTKKLALVSTIQFVATLHLVKIELEKLEYLVKLPQSKPLSPGEILGCTAPQVCSDAIIYLGDGRFHLEAIMIANPNTLAYKYDPYTKKFTQESYDFNEMIKMRNMAMEKTKEAQTFGLILGTLGRQGSFKVFNFIESKLKEKNLNTIKILLSEIAPSKLQLFYDIDAFIQVACPRLSIDWGTFFSKPLLTPYECATILAQIDEEKKETQYPMDYYSKTSPGEWTPNYSKISAKEIVCCGKCKKEN